MSRANDAPGERARVFTRIAPVILTFRAERGFNTFHAEELRDYVIERLPDIAPDSPGRILRELRLLGRLDYVVINRRQSLYQFRQPRPDPSSSPVIDADFWRRARQMDFLEED
ncbi:MAG: hypothetical protein ABWY63_14300 [Hyphomicrobiaceae bacterium]